MNQHRGKYYSLLSGNVTDTDDDEFSPGMHLIEHGFSERTDFNENFELCILLNCSPKVLEVQEHKLIHTYRTLKPSGINTCNPFSIPLL